MPSCMIWAEEGAPIIEGPERSTQRSRRNARPTVSMNSGEQCKEWVFSRPAAAERSVRSRVESLLGLATRSLLTPACAVSAGQTQIASGGE